MNNIYAKVYEIKYFESTAQLAYIRQLEIEN